MKYQIEFNFRGFPYRVAIEEEVLNGIDWDISMGLMLKQLDDGNIEFVHPDNEDEAKYLLPGHQITLIEKLDD